MPLLRRVSRSFYLSIRLLPPALRQPVAVGYLLARATDTVADTAACAVVLRRPVLQDLVHAVALPETPPPTLAQGLATMAPDVLQPDEKRLLDELPGVLRLLCQLPSADRIDVQQVITIIGSGQQLDLQRFGEGLRALASTDELDDYTWRVAGCVGEFWTRVCARYLPEFASAPLPELLRQGRRYGQGLQRLNLLRDSAEDLAQSRCYWPLEMLAPLGLDAVQLARGIQQRDAALAQRLQPLFLHWLDVISAELEDGLRYSLALRPWRLRAASVLPALIGMRTVGMLRQRGAQALFDKVKVPRHEIRRLMLQLLWALPSRPRLQALFERQASLRK